MDEIHIVGIDHFQKLNSSLIAAPLEYMIIEAEKQSLKLGPKITTARMEARRKAEKSLTRQEEKFLKTSAKELQQIQSQLTTETDSKKIQALVERKNGILQRTQAIEQRVQANVAQNHNLANLRGEATFNNTLIQNMSPYLLRMDPNTNILNRIAQYDALLTGAEAEATAARFGGIYGALSTTGVGAGGAAAGQAAQPQFGQAA